MVQEILVDFRDLSLLSIPCRKCKTLVLLDCMDQEAGIPDRCPGCSENYEDAFRSTLRTYREVYRKLADPDVRRVEVRIQRGQA